MSSASPAYCSQCGQPLGVDGSPRNPEKAVRCARCAQRHQRAATTTLEAIFAAPAVDKGTAAAATRAVDAEPPTPPEPRLRPPVRRETWSDGTVIAVVVAVGAVVAAIAMAVMTFNGHTTYAPNDKSFENAVLLTCFRKMLTVEIGDTLWLAKATLSTASRGPSSTRTKKPSP